MKTPVPTPLDPRLANLVTYAAERNYPCDLIGGPDGMAIQFLVPHSANGKRAFQSAEDKLVILIYTVEDRVEACAPYILSIPDDLAHTSGIFHLLGDMNFSSDLARYGVDPEDGEVRCIVVLPLAGDVDAPLFDLLIKAVCDGVERLGEAMSDVIERSETPSEGRHRHNAPLLN